jgi:hypothetical protein
MLVMLEKRADMGTPLLLLLLFELVGFELPQPHWNVARKPMVKRVKKLLR